MINDLDEVQYEYLLSPTFQFVNSAGKPITGGWMEVYIHGTRTKYYCVSDWDGTLHPFKIPLDSLGSNIVLASPAFAYDVYVYNRFGSLIMSRYNVIPSTGGASGVTPVDITIESQDETVDVTVSGTTYNLSISGTIDKLDTVSADVEELKDIIASGLVQSDWDESDTTSPAYIQNKPDLSIYATTEDLDTASGNLVDLIEEVSANIPQAQVQSDWDESDTTSPAYIKNKPEESTLIAGDNIGIFASGSDYVISASGVDTSEFATHTEVNTVSSTIMDIIENVSGINEVYHNATLTGDGTSGNPLGVNIPLVASGQDYIASFNQYGVSVSNTSTHNMAGLSSDHLIFTEDGDTQEVTHDSIIEWNNKIDAATASAIASAIVPAQVQSDWTEDDTTDPAYIKNKPDEVNLVAGDNISIVASGTDLIISASGSSPQPTVPNVEIVSPSGSIVVSATVDPQTNTKTFSIDVSNASGVEYGQFYATGVTGVANVAKTKGNISVNNGKIQLHKGKSYHITMRGCYTQSTLLNELSFFNFIEYISYRAIAVNVNKTLSMGQYWEISYDLYNLANDVDYPITFNNISGAVIADLIVEVHSLAGGNGTGGSASGVEYTAGYGIQILNDVISVSGINPQVNADWNAVSGISQVLNKPNEIEIVAGSGISIEESNNQLIISSTVTGGGGGSGVNYQAGDHIDITNDTISVTGITELVAGNAITITVEGDSAIISSNGEAQVQSDWNVTDSSSKAYIRNKPSIPAAQIQSDWNQTNTSSKDYIKNKPTIKNYTGASGILVDNTTITLDEPLGLVAGSGINIVIDGNSAIICVSGVTGGGGSVTGNYNAGYGIEINNDTISVDTTIIPSISAVSAMIASASVSDNLFIAEYGITTINEMLNAYTSGKYIIVHTNNVILGNNYYIPSSITYSSNANELLIQFRNPGNYERVQYANGTWTESLVAREYQVDWNETSQYNAKYIKNKPDLSVYTTSAQVSAIVEAATGSIPTPVQINSDWTATSGVAEILNKPIEANLLPGSGITITASGSDWVINTTPIELVTALPANPVSGVLYLIPEA